MMRISVEWARANGVSEEVIRQAPVTAEPAPEPAPKSNKYHARRTEYDGITYASKAEALRAAELDAMVRAGKVAWWLRQVTFRLGCPECVYRPDFLVAEPSGSGTSQVFVHAEDVKGFETAAFKRVRQLWARYGPMPLHILGRGWVETIPRGTEELS